LRQRQVAGLLPQAGEGVGEERYGQLLFEWAYPQVAQWCRAQGRPYPPLGPEGEIAAELPRGVRLRC
jgi:tRNA (guanosine-2'-O-)-methyltransferase